VRRAATVLIAAAFTVSLARPVSAYSVLAHEAMVDALWDDTIVPVLRQLYPATDAPRLQRARAYAYGGSVIQDLGYYPFGNKQFTNLVHYVRSGDFVEALVRDARDVDELAFALGAAAHYAADNVGHPDGVNRAVPLIYPKLQAKHGNDVIYADDPRRHVMVEFAFDVVQVATGAYLPDGFRAYIGFEVAKPALERAFLATYGLTLKDLFADPDLAIGTFRYAVSQTIPEMTRVAWKSKQDEIRKLAPTVRPDSFIYSLTRRDYEQAYGTAYRKPGFFTRFLGLLVRILPKIGPLSALAFRVPTPEAERLFAESFRASRERYRTIVIEARDGRLELANTDFDVGRQGRAGENPIADAAYIELLDTLSARGFAATPPELRGDIAEYFMNLETAAATDKKLRKQAVEIRGQLARLAAGP
jgi:hypothetical protein